GTMDGSALGAGRIHDGDDVARPLFEGLFGDPVGESLTALVEDDDAGKRREASEQVLVDRKLPEELRVRDRSGDQDDVVGAVAEAPVCDVNIPALCIPDWIFHRPVSAYSRGEIVLRPYHPSARRVHQSAVVP